MGKPKTYSSRHVLITLGYHEVTGTADGDFISIEPHGEGSSKIVGADGSVAFGVDPDWTATMTITLMQTSDSIAWASERYSKDQKTGIKEFFPAMVHDLSGTLLFHAEYATISNQPTRSFTKGAPTGAVDIIIATGDATWEDETRGM